MRDQVNASALSALTKRRIQQALEQALRRYDFPEGKIRFKNLKIDLGDISHQEFEFDFFKRLENACDELARQILQEHQYQKWSEKNRNTRFRSEQVEKHMLVDELDRLLKLLEGQQRIPDREQLMRSYFERYMERMPANSKVLLDQLIPVPSEISKNNSPSADAFESLDYLLDLLNEGEMTASSFSNMLRKYQERFGEPMPNHIQRTLFSALEDAKPEIADSESTEIEKRNRLTTDTGENAERSEQHDSSNVKTRDKTVRFVLKWIDEHQVSGNWLNRLKRAFNKEFGFELAGQLLDYLSAFNNQLEINAGNSGEPLKAFLKEKYNRIEDFRKSGLATFPDPSVKDETVDRLDATKKGQDKKLPFDEKSKKYKADKSYNSRFSYQEIGFVLKWIDEYGVSGNWLNRLKRAFKKQFDFELAGQLLDRLIEFNKQQEIDPTSGHEVLQVLLKESFHQKGSIESQDEEEKIPAVSQSEIKEVADSEILSFILRWIVSNELKGEWVKAIFKQINRTFETDPPAYIVHILQSFRSSEKTLSAYKSREIIQQLIKGVASYADKGVSKPIATEKSSDSLARQFAFVAFWIEQNSMSGEWRSALKDQLERELNQPIISKLENAIDRFEKVLRKREVRFLKSTHLIDFLTEQLFSGKTKSGFYQSGQLSDNLIKERSGQLSKQVAFAVNWWSENASSEKSISELSGKMNTAFGNSLLREINDAFDKLKHREKEEAIGSDVARKFLEELTISKSEDLEKPENHEEVSNVVSRQLHYILNWLTKNQLSENWTDKLYASLQADLAMPVHSRLEIFLNDYNESYRETANQSAEVGHLIEELTSQLFEEKGWQKTSREESSPGLLSEQIAISLHWISTHRHLSNWFNELRAAIYQRTGSFMHVGLEQLLNDFDHKREAGEISEKDQQLLIELLADNLLSTDPMREKDQNWTGSIQSKELNAAFSQHVSFVLSWFLKNDRIDNWQSKLESDLKKKFTKTHPKVLQTLKELYLEFNSAEDKNLRSQEILKYLANRWVVDINSSDTQSPVSDQKTGDLDPETEGERSEFTAEESAQDRNAQVLFVLHWLAENDVEEGWLNALLDALKIEFNKVDSELKLLLKTYDEERFEEQGSSLESHDLINRLTESLEIISEEKKPSESKSDRISLVDVSRQLTFALFWISRETLYHDWAYKLIDALEVKFQSRIHRKLKERLISESKRFSDDKLSEHQRKELIDRLVEFSLVEEGIVESEKANRKIRDKEKDLLLVEQVALTIHWINQTELEEKTWVDEFQTFIQQKTGENIHPELETLLRSFQKKPRTASEDSQFRVDLIEYISSALMSDQFRDELPKLKTIGSENLRVTVSKQIAFISKWLIENERDENWVSKLSEDLSLATEDKHPGEAIRILQHLDSNYSNTAAFDRRSIIAYLVDNVPKIKPVNKQNPEIEPLEDQLPRIDSTALLSKQIAFILDWLAQDTMSINWLEQLTQNFRLFFGEAFPSQVQALFDKIKSNELPATLEHDEDRIRQYLVEELLDHKESQGTEPNETNPATSSEQNYALTLGASDVLQSIKKHLKPTSREHVEWSTWISSQSEQITPQKWLNFIVSQHEKSYGRALSMNKQLLFLEVLAENNGIVIEIEMEREVKFKNAVADYVERANNRKKNTLLIDADVLMDSLAALSFDKQWFHAVKKSFENYFEKRMPLALQKVLFQFRKESLLSALDQSLELRPGLSQELMSYFDTPNYTDVRDVIQEIEFSETESWLSQIMEAYKRKEKKELPLSVLVELSKFHEKYSEWAITDFSALQKQLVDRSIQEKFETRRMDESKHSKQSLLKFLSEELPKLKTAENWKLTIEGRYQEQAGRPMPGVFRQLIEELDTKLHEVLIPKQSVNEIYEAFENFLSKKPEVPFSGKLVPLFENLKESDATSWFAAVIKSYKNKYKTEIPLEAQIVLLDFSAQLDSGSGTVDTTEKKVGLEKIIENVKTQLSELESKRAKQDQQFLIRLKDWVNENLLENWSHAQMKSEYERVFGHTLPVWLKEALIDRLRRETMPELNAPVQAHRMSDSTVVPPKLKQSTVHKISDKAKVLKLKKQLEDLKDGKETDVEIIQDAGIMVGWLFWKKCFDRFGWLDDGKFFKKEGIYSGVLAANWLTRLGTSAYPEMLHPFMIRVCDLLEEETEYLTDYVLETHMNGYNLEESVTNYYADLMMMWTIFKIEEPGEFKELFVQREAMVTQTFFGWDLEIVPEAYDALLQKHPIPWPMTFIRFPWTNQTFNVKW